MKNQQANERNEEVEDEEEKIKTANEINKQKHNLMKTNPLRLRCFI